MEVGRIILLQILIGDLCSRLWFGIVDNLALHVLLSMTFIDKMFKGMFPMD